MRIYDMRAFGRMNAGQRKEAMGLSATAHLPEYLPGLFEVHGITLYLEGKGAVRGHKRQRVRACCPECHVVFAAGNLAQHHQIHTEAGRARLRAKAERKVARNAAWKARQAASTGTADAV